VYLADFGWSRKAAAADAMRTVLPGTEYFQAPEVTNKSQYGAPAEVYSFGKTILHVAIANFRVIETNDLKRHLGQLNSINFDLATLVTSAMNPVPESRPTLLQYVSLLESTMC